jgi:hypothetical protein
METARSPWWENVPEIDLHGLARRRAAMSKKTQKTLYYTLSFLSLILAFVVIAWLAGGAPFGAAGVGTVQEGLASGKDHPEIRATMAVKDRHTRILMAHPDIVGTGEIRAYPKK